MAVLLVARACAIVMGAKQTKEDETPTSPKSPRVSPVDIASGDETPVPALLDKEASRGEEALTPKSDVSVKSRADDADANSPSDSAPGRAASQKMITEALDEAKNDKADDPNRINYTINAVEAIVENRTRGLGAELAATRKELSETQQQLEKMMELLERVAAKVKA